MKVVWLLFTSAFRKPLWTRVRETISCRVRALRQRDHGIDESLMNIVLRPLTGSIREGEILCQD